MASHCEHWKRAPFFSPEKKELSLSNQECNSSLSVWCLGCWFNGFLGQPSLSATGDPLAFIPSDSAILLHSSPGSGYHRSRTILTLPAQRIGTVALCCHCLCGVWNVLFLSLLLLIHLQNLRGGAAGEGIFLKLRLRGYLYVLHFTVWRSWDHVFIGSFPFPSSMPVPNWVPHKHGYLPCHLLKNQLYSNWGQRKNLFLELYSAIYYQEGQNDHTNLQ